VPRAAPSSRNRGFCNFRAPDLHKGSSGRDKTQWRNNWVARRQVESIAQLVQVNASIKPSFLTPRGGGIFRVPRPKRAVTRHRNAEASLEKSTASSAASCFETFLRSKFQRGSCAVFPPFRFPRHVAGKLYGCYPLIAMLVTMNHTF
jgi:hypothetical protein